MKTMTLKEFAAALKSRLDRYTHEELKKIILARGMTLPPRERALFLDEFVLPDKEEGKKKTRKKDREEEGKLLLKDIESFGRRVDKSEYTDGWGWDDQYHDERALGDDHWVAEIDDLFDRVRDIYEDGDYQTARRAFESLLNIYREGGEEGKFSGYDHDDMIETDIHETTLKYLRCIYLTELPSDRAGAIWKAISGISYDARDLNIYGLINIAAEELPQFEDFGQRWLEFLKKQKVTALSSGLTREAVRLFRGIAGLETLATEDGLKYPGAFIEWLEALKNKKNDEEMIRAASLGLERLPARLCIRSKIADFLHDAAIRLNKRDLIDRSLKEALFADPCLDRLLNALDYAGNAEGRRRILDEFLALLEILKNMKRGAPRWEVDQSPDLLEREASGSLSLQCRLLKGDYEIAAAMMEKSKPLGWSLGEDPGVLGVPFFLMAGWNQEKNPTANLSALWSEATDPRPLFSIDIDDRDYDEADDDDDDDDDDGAVDKVRPGRQRPAKTDSRFRKYLEGVLKEFPVPAVEQEKHFTLAKKIALKRIEAIVGNKRRKSYWKAAELLLAVAEVYWSNDRTTEGRMLIDRMKNKYNRHTAFRAELRTLAQKSGIFLV